MSSLPIFDYGAPASDGEADGDDDDAARDPRSRSGAGGVDPSVAPASASERIVPPEGAERSRMEEIIGEAMTPENTFCHVCGYGGTVKACQAVLEPRGFRGPRNKREDGSFDMKVESYG